MLNDKTFDQGIALIVNSFQGLSLKKNQIETWRLLLSDLSDQEYINAILLICQNRRDIYPGTNIPAMIRQEAKGFNSKALSSEEAWEKVMKAISDVGYSRAPIFEGHPEIMRAVKTIGWRNICLSENIEATRAHFYRTFEAYQQRTEKEEINEEVRMLAGMLVKELPK